jgi:glycosyltransferase involved in cell wall biosynthesis
MTEKFPLTAIILTQDEAANIRGCIERLDWVKDVVLLDSGSTDETIAIAKDTRADVRVFSHWFTDFGAQRNWALDHTGPLEWVLFLDADEHCTEPCATCIQEAVKSPAEFVGYYLAARNFFLGTWIRRSTMHPSWQLRLLKLGQVRFQRRGHGQQEVTEGPLGRLAVPYDHYPFSKGVSGWIERHNRYSSMEGELILALREQPMGLADLFQGDPVKRRRCLKRIFARMQITRPLVMFLYTYFIRLGVLDGKAGLAFSFLRVSHEIHNIVKIWELQAAAKRVQRP